MCGVLKQAGLSVATALSGPAALTLLADHEEPFDVVLLDIMMPEMDGYAVLKKIRTSTALAGLPVIAVTAVAMLGDREQILAAGFDDYLAKPVVPPQLMALLVRWIKPPTR